MSALDPVTNFGKVTVSTGYDASATTIVLSGGHGAKLPQPSTDGSFNLVWWNSTDYSDPTDDPNREIVRCTARSTDTLTVVRAQESTSAATHNTSAKTYLMAVTVTQKLISDLNTLFGHIKYGTVTVSYNGSWVSFSTPYFSSASSYAFIPFGIKNYQLIGVTYSGLTTSGLWVYPASDQTSLSYIAIGT